MKNFSVSLNFDSLAEAYDWPSQFDEDSAYTKGLNRITELCSKYKIPLTIFIVGKDLENKKNFDILKKISERNDIEIANHSYNHLHNFGALNENETYEEIYRSHEIIYKCTGKECKGFVSPAWAISKNLIKCLIDMQYVYDTSYFRSIFLYPMIAKIFCSQILAKKYSRAFKIINRRDYLFPFKYKNEPFFLNANMNVVNKDDPSSILEIPVPVINNMQTPIWNTVGFFFGFNYLKKKLKILLDKKKPFYFLIHPADFLDKKDAHPDYLISLERMNLESYSSKLDKLEEIFKLIISHEYQAKKLIDLAIDEKNR